MKSKSSSLNGFNKLARLVLPGALILGTSCAYNVRKSLVSAGLDFVKGTAGDVLDEFFPVQDLFATGE